MTRQVDLTKNLLYGKDEDIKPGVKRLKGKTEETIPLHIQVPISFHVEVKQKAAARHMTMTNLMIEAYNEWKENHLND